MNIRRLSVALVIALLLSGSFTYVLSRKIDHHAAERIQEQKYVAPSKPLEAGQSLKIEDFELIEWPASDPLQGSFTQMQDLVGRVVLYPMGKGQPILDRYLATAGSGVGLASRIPIGMRAIALRSDEVVGVAGFLLPGSHLDVLVTYRSDKSPEPTTSTVLQNAEVLAAGHQVEPDPEGKPATVTVVTLLLTPQDAERAVLASTQGMIHFVLRSGTDKVHTQDDPITLSQLSQLPSSSANSHIVAPVGAPKIRLVTLPRQAETKDYLIETIRGDKNTTEKMSEVSHK